MSNEQNGICPDKRSCDNCGATYSPDPRNWNRGWGRTCSKTCAAEKREKSRPGYTPIKVAENNIRRMLWNEHLAPLQSSYGQDYDLGNYDPGDSEYWDQKDFD